MHAKFIFIFKNPCVSIVNIDPSLLAIMASKSVNTFCEDRKFYETLFKISDIWKK